MVRRLLPFLSVVATLALGSSAWALNPQPEPPSVFRVIATRSWVGLNPQPEPPSYAARGIIFLNSQRGNVQLNPQPEPPGRHAGASGRSIIILGSPRR